MLASKEVIRQQLDQLSEDQLQQIIDFIAFMRFRQKREALVSNADRLAVAYQEFAQEDRELAEAGIGEYAEMLSQEDLQ